jgi:hypothetical protein
MSRPLRIGDRVRLVGHPKTVGVVIHSTRHGMVVLWDDDASENVVTPSGYAHGEPFVERTGRVWSRHRTRQRERTAVVP